MYQVDQGAYWQSQLLYWGPKVIIALVILVATYIAARATIHVATRIRTAMRIFGPQFMNCACQ